MESVPYAVLLVGKRTSLVRIEFKKTDFSSSCLFLVEKQYFNEKFTISFGFLRFDLINFRSILNINYKLNNTHFNYM